MRKAIIILAAIAAAAGSIMSCNRIDMPQQVIPGKTVSTITFNISTPAPNNVVSTKAMTDADETNIESLALFFFKEGNIGAANRVFVSGSDFSLGTPDIVTPTNYVYTIRISGEKLDSDVHSEVICSGNWYIYAVANWNKSWCSVDLETLKTKTRAELDDFRIVKTSTSPNPSETALLLAGRYGEDNTGLAVINPDDDGVANLSGRVHLRRFVSKVTFRFNSGSNVNFTPERIYIYNYSRSSTLFERSGWEQKDGTESYGYGTFSGSLEKAVATSGSVMSDATNAGIGYEVLHDEHGYYYTFYMPENIPTPKAGASINSYNDRDKCTYSGSTRTFTNAPDDATYVVVTGSYEGPAIELDDASHTATQNPASDKKVQGNVSYTIHLGNFSTTGTNTLGSDDNFTVRRNAKYTYNVTVNGAKSIAVEAAYNIEDNPGAEGHLITTATGTTNVRLDSHYEQVIIAIPDGIFSTYQLILDTPYSHRQIVSGRNNDLDVNWVKFAKPASETTFRTYAQVLAGPLGNIFDLTEDLNDGDEADDHNTYYIKGSDGKRYTAAYVNEYFYDTIEGDVNDLSLSKFINAADRELTFSTGVNNSADGHSSFTITPIFSIRQRSIVSPYDVDAVANPFGIETLEETAANSTFGGSSSANSDDDGWANTTAGLNFSSTNWSSYVNEAQNGHINNADVPSGAVTSDGSKGIYQCLSRNRDLNGNGKIDREEVRWYLPAMSQTNTIWFSDPFLTEEQHPDNLNRYYCSTYSLNTWWALEGTAYNNPGAKEATLVRCVRALNSHDQLTTPVWSAEGNGDGNTVFTISGLNGAAERVDRQIGEYQPHEAGDKQNDLLPRSFVAAKDYVESEIVYRTHTYPSVSTVLASTDCDGTAWVENVPFDKATQGVEVAMTLSSTTPDTQNIASFGTSASYGSWNSGSVVHFYYPNGTNTSEMIMWVNTSSRTSKSILQVTPGSMLHITFNGDAVVVNGEEITLTSKNTSWTFNESSVSVGSREGSTRTYQSNLTINLVDMTHTPDIIEEGTGVKASTFSQAAVTGTNLCSANYYENADKSDLGQWRVPNEKEFSIMYLAQKDGQGTFLKFESSAGTAARTQFNRTTDKGYTDTGMSFFYFNSNSNITTGLDSTKPGSFYVRCVRDGESPLPDSGTNQSDQNSMSNGGNLW